MSWHRISPPNGGRYPGSRPIPPPPEGAPARQDRKRAVLPKGGHAEDRVVPPIGPLAPLPELKPAERQGSVEADGKLLDPGKQGLASGRVADGLDQCDAIVPLHQTDQAAHRGSAHQAVGIEHDREVVVAARPIEELANVAGLAAQVAGTAPVSECRDGADPQRGGTSFFGGRDVRRSRVAEHVNDDIVGCAEARERRPHHTDAREYVVDILLEDRDDEGGAAQACRNRADRGGVPLDRREKVRPCQPAVEAEHELPHDETFPGHNGDEREGKDPVDEAVRLTGQGRARERK